ncbi:hypothetical protein XA68_16260 [Ophiocordyceps unilateralis]|uniref:Uncharacterized protein n=1 Tax=Ophiocordyceps unilateralis TaxID=268505 RepID=A0A2A9P6J4_OPHUN|nr:hypothetical protein XA68_16260 [Ophiocordyceps unilateralis]
MTLKSRFVGSGLSSGKWSNASPQVFSRGSIGRGRGHRTTREEAKSHVGSFSSAQMSGSQWLRLRSSHGQGAISVDTAIEAKLLEYLPRYMVPTSFISMQNLPLIPTGKTHRKQLRGIGPEPLGSMRTVSLCMMNFSNWGGKIPLAQCKSLLSARDVDIQLSVADLFRVPSLDGCAMQARIKTRDSYPDAKKKPLIDLVVEAALLEEVDMLDDDRILSGNIADILPLTSFQRNVVMQRPKAPGFALGLLLG